MTWLAVLIVAAVSLLFRVSMLSRPATTMTPRMDRALSAMGPAVITSLIAAEAVGGSSPGAGAAFVAACTVAAAITRRSGNLLYGTAGAMGIVWIGILVGL